MQYAKVENGIVTDLSPTNETWIACGDAVQTGWLFNNSTFYPVLPTYESIALTPATEAQKGAISALMNGVSISSVSVPAINGNYSTSSNSINNIGSVTTYILLNNSFPGNISTFPWYDKNGSVHYFPTIDIFKSFATAFANYVASVQLYLDSNGSSGPLPPNQIAIG